ncbi:MAG TPA: hypothetical protein PLF27_07450 [Sedimentibacter sp.]|nr:hypothetical protein [Sedimentibacter sp.]
MDERDINSAYYLVPANVSTRFEFFEGFGWPELKVVTIALAIGALIFFLTGMIVKTETIRKEDLTMEQRMTLNVYDDSEFVTFEKEVLSTPIRLLFVVIPTAAAYFAVKRDPSTKLSLVKMFKFSREYQKSQKRYLYKYGSGSEG